MNEIEFKIFTRKEGFQLTVNSVVYPLLIVSYGITFLANKYSVENTMVNIAWVLWIVMMVAVVYFKLAQSLTRKSLRGKVDGRLIFRENEIIVNSQSYTLKRISEMEFSVSDYDYKWEYQTKGDLNPGRSNGTDNFCKILLTDGQKVFINFQLMNEKGFLKMRELLIHYHVNGKLSFSKVVECLGLDKSEEIEALRAGIEEVAE